MNRHPAQQQGCPQRPPGNLDLITTAEAGVAVQRAQGHQGQTDGPEAEAPQPGLAGGDQQGIVEGVAQMGVGDGDEFVEQGGELGGAAGSFEGGRVDAMFAHQGLGQPAGAPGPVVPHVFQDIGHLQALAEGDGQSHNRLLLVTQHLGVIAEQLGEHLTHHAGDVIAVAVERIEIGQAVAVAGLLEVCHALEHDGHAAREGHLLARGEAARHPDHPLRVADQIALAGRRSIVQQREERAGEACRRHGAAEGIHQDAGEVPLLGEGEFGAVFDGVRDAAQQVTVANDGGEGLRQLGDGQREAAGYALKNMQLIGGIGPVAGVTNRLLRHCVSTN